MKLIKPDWVSHNGKPMFCIDVHPDGTRFATGGHGEECGSIIIWNMAPVTSPIAETDENVPKILCQMDDHAGCVNCLRWSNSGNYLVSGGDDKMVVVWNLSKKSGSSSLFGSFGSIVNIETWKSAHVLRGHSGDVLDVNWSPDDSYIATGSVDNTIIIWDALNFPQILKTIKGHEGLVKGIVFDPVGKYMASQSDDKTLCIWNVNDWSLEKKIKDPFTESSGTTHVLRLHWSPDGQFLVSAHAMNNGGPVAKIIERNGWRVKKDFVGHRKAITCVRFSERMLMSKECGKSKFVCCGIGSRDRSLSVWLTSLKRPLVVLHNLFENSIMDIAWSDCGYILLACSLDGTVACLEFTEEELGNVVSNEEKLIFHKKTFGTSIKSNKSLIFSSVHETYFSKNQKTEKPTKATVQQPSVKSSVSVVSPKLPGVSPFKAKEKKFTFSSDSIPDASCAKEILEKQKETKTKDGKRRIVPLMLDAPCDSSPEIPLKANTAQSSGLRKNQSLASTSSGDVDFTTSVKRKLSEGPDVTTPVKKPKKKDKEKSKKGSTPDKKSNETTDINEIQFENTQNIIPTPDVKDVISFKFSLPLSSGIKESGLIEVQNEASSDTDSKSFLKYYVNENLKWSTVLPASVTQVSANKHLTCAACVNKTLHVMSNNGRRLIAGISCDSNISILQCQSHNVMVILSSGYVNVWNIKDRWCLVKNAKMNPIVNKRDTSLSTAYMNDDGYPIISLSDDSSYIFDVALSTWCEISDGSTFPQSEFSSFLRDERKRGTLDNLQPLPASFSQSQSSKGLSKQHVTSIAHIESQMCSSLLLQSCDEYKFWLMTYIRYLIQMGNEERIRELCEEFLHSDNEGRRFKPIKVFKEYEIIQDILDVLAMDVKFNRLHAELQEQLNMVT